MKYLFLFLPLLICFSCELEKEIDYTTYFVEERIIIHGFISEQNGVELLVKKTLQPNRTSADDRLTNPTAALFENGAKACELLPTSDGYHFEAPSDFKIKQGVGYQIRVQADGVPEAFSTEQIIPKAAVIDSLSFTSRYKGYFYWTHDSKQRYGYHTELHPFILDKDKFRPSPWDKFPMMGRGEFRHGSNADVFSLRDYNDSLRIDLFTLSEDLYLFLQSEKDYEDSQNDPFFEQPYPVFSNIKGGYGIFAAYGISSTTYINEWYIEPDEWEWERINRIDNYPPSWY